MSTNSQRPDPAGSDNSGLLHGDVTRKIIAAFYAVKREVGPGFPEYLYANGVSVQLRELGLNVRREVPYEMVFHGVVIGLFRADIVVEGLVIVEVKVSRGVLLPHREQVWRYAKTAGLPVGMVLNFGENPGFARVLTNSGP
ncbi:MAG TPA: GxxExxY protein [Gemmatimonadaceae bacterium]|nr:GxxExxY protein [Gemmatimonadaceae bacterium]